MIIDFKTTIKVHDPFGMITIGRNWVSGSENYRYAFQGQESDDEVKGADNSINYKYRIQDPRLGRFFSVDPLAPKYPDYTPYSFSGNILINAVELEGLEPGILFNSEVEAAANFGLYYNDNSIRDNQEYGSTIYKTVDASGVTKYAYSIANIGTTGATVSCSPAPSGTTPVADIHSHAAYSFGMYLDNIFSGVKSTPKQNKAQTKYDVGDNNRTGLVGYLATPNGSLQKYDPSTGQISTVNNSNPSDSNDPSRKNSKSSNYETFIKLGNIEFNSNLARQSSKNQGVLIVKDVNTGKDYGVVRNANGSYNFYNGSNNKP